MAYTMYEYKYHVCLFTNVFFLAREDSYAQKMKSIYEKSMGVKLKLKRKKRVYVEQPPYEIEQEELKVLEGGSL